MTDFCTIDANGLIIERITSNKDVLVGDTRYPQGSLKQWTPAERAKIGVALITRNIAPVHDAATHKAVLTVAGPGDPPADTWAIVALTDAEFNQAIKNKLSQTDTEVIRLLDELVDALVSDPMFAAKVSQRGKDKITTRKAPRSKIRR